MQLNASQVESIVRDVLAQMAGHTIEQSAPAAAPSIPKTAKVAMLTAPKTIEVK